MQTTDPTGIFNRNKLSEEFSNVLPDEARLKLDAILLEIQTDFPEICYSLEYLNTKFRSFLTPQSTCGQKLESLFQAAADISDLMLISAALKAVYVLETVLQSFTAELNQNCIPGFIRWKRILL